MNMIDFERSKKRILRNENEKQRDGIQVRRKCHGERGWDDEMCWVCNGDGFTSEEVFKI